MRLAVRPADGIHERTAQVVRAESLDPGLCERNFGDLRGTPYSELTEDIFAPGYAPPGGERWSDFDARVDAVWDRVTARARLVHGNLAVVTHGLVCRSLAARKLELPDSVPEPQRWGNTALTIVDGIVKKTL